MRKSLLPKLILGLRPTLIVSIGVLTLVSVGLVAAMSYLSSRAIVSSLASGMINLGLARLEQAVRREFDAVVDQTGYVQRAIVKGEYSLGEPQKLADFLKGSLAAAPQIDGIIVAGTDFSAVAAIRQERGGAAETRILTIRPESGLRKVAVRAAASDKAFWREPRFLRRRKSTVIGLCVPIRHGDTYRGFMVAGSFSRTLSEFTRDLSRPGRFEAFILFGRDRVLAHPGLINGSPKVNADNPLLALGEVGDPVLAHFAEARPRDDARLKLRKGAEAMLVDVDGTEHQIFLKKIDGYGDVPLYVGAHFVETRLDRVIKSLHRQGIAAGGLLLAALVLAVILSRTIANPIRRASDGASRIQALDFDKVAPLQRSRLKEIDDLAVSFNAMLGGLASFGRYVPRSLVTRLIRENRVGAGSEERELTVMFTDIADFSTICESMSAKEVADFINAHLTLVSDCIEAEGGTIDKFIGDAAMAFWGAPDTLENTAEPACRAALAIRKAIAEDNRRRAKQGLEPVRMRIGIHTGALVVGDIGTPTRTNYTVVGDIVNGAQRLEALGKEIEPDAEISILISRETEKLLGTDIERHAEGTRKVKGKQQQLEVFRLVCRPGRPGQALRAGL
jgi:adenylate cyclase